MTANETETSQPEKSRTSLLVKLGAGAALLIILACVAFYVFFIRGVSGEPADADTVQSITAEFVSALQNRDYPAAHGMFSDKNRDSIPIETLETLANESSIVAYQRLAVCEFKVFFGKSGKHLTGQGLLDYEGGVIKFESTLLQDPDGTWQMYGFFLKPDVDTTPWGACKNAQPASATTHNPQPVSAEALSEILWVSDPSLPQYDPNSSAYAEFPNAIQQIAAMGEDASDAADDLAVAIRYPRQDAYLAAQALLKLGPDITGTTIPLLIDNLRNEKTETRTYSLILLASVGERASCAVAKIAPLLWDPDPSVRSASAFALKKTAGGGLIGKDYEIPITQSFLATSITPDIPEGKVVENARNWWNEQGSKVNWHPSYGICDP
jgi:hypothetical protein